ncbi:MAG: molybdenum ABC transporter ATP-binding protein [Spirochaetes bacterium GWF1_31_7]|nr:MAG: molybdenum ABC transporter ATP-binding protein [Spirochaetes bacterium GWE1_32_154]OHD44825.1 MAG: molybdenum ABC transporter ATP-binding protein [Spirochaetes bacterium GWE2_31_10]OHD49616.1 MAG: molybdenum ABC transporter ATP-binding protein [Spirochaetes bacterium GWF1_31_7]HBD93744.1 molybdenum ABC transporter ATP-binding protein [Spirochaetia bacterium]
MLEVNIHKQLGNFNLSMSFSSDKGVLGILGASGSGKSITLKCISGLVTPDSGSVRINGKEVFNSEQKINIPPRQRKIGYVFQNYALFPHLNVYKNIEYGLYTTDDVAKRKKVAEMIERVHLTGLEKRLPSRLSGGQQQRVALARTLITEPELLLLDEPLSALDVHIKHTVQKELIDIIRNNYNGITLLVTHNIEEAFSMSHNIMVMDKGLSTQYGTKHEIIQNPVSVSSARLTGCKNIFEAEIIGEDQVFYTVLLQGLIVRLNKKRTYALTKVMLGIRAHHIIINPKDKPDTNLFEAEVISTIEGVFSTTLVLQTGEVTFEMTVAKSDCPNISNCTKRTKTIYLPPDKLFLMNEN